MVWPAATAVGLRIFQAEADFHRHLEVRDGSVHQVAANRLHFEPVQATHCLCRSLQTAADCRVNPVGRGSDNLDHAVGVIAHRVPLSWQRLKDSPRLPPSGELSPVFAVAHEDFESWAVGNAIRLSCGRPCRGDLVPATFCAENGENVVRPPQEVLRGAISAVRERFAAVAGQSERTILIGTILLVSAVSAMTAFVLTQYLSVDAFSSLVFIPDDCA